VRFVAAISQGFRTCLKLDAILARQKLHRVAATKIACVNGPLQCNESILVYASFSPSSCYAGDYLWAKSPFSIVSLSCILEYEAKLKSRPSGFNSFIDLTTPSKFSKSAK